MNKLTGTNRQIFQAEKSQIIFIDFFLLKKVARNFQPFKYGLCRVTSKGYVMPGVNNFIVEIPDKQYLSQVKVNINAGKE